MENRCVRSSNLELYRIILMLLIVAHHFVGNSEIYPLLCSSETNFDTLFLYILGAWGKAGINGFVLITGFFMCKKATITLQKFLKLLLEIMFYRITIYLVFIVSGYCSFSFTEMISIMIPVNKIESNFTSCFLIFYLCIPFLNILVRNMDEKRHILLLCLCGFVYIMLGTVPKMSVRMNYVSWFVVLYFISSYIRLYPKAIFDRVAIWGAFSIVMLCIGTVSVFVCLKFNKFPYTFLEDCNTLIAVLLGICSFLFFKNIKIKNNCFVNTIASSVFGVLQIHANSDTMRRWLWKDFLNVVKIYYMPTSQLIFWSITTVVCVFFVCVLIDQIRLCTFEKYVFDKILKNI